VTRFSSLVLAELQRARQKFPRPQHSLAEAREVLREEFEEFVDASRLGRQYAPVLHIDTTMNPEASRVPINLNETRDAAIKELVQVAAMAFRTAIEVYGFEEEG
jgi:hypothetical protein